MNSLPLQSSAAVNGITDSVASGAIANQQPVAVVRPEPSGDVWAMKVSEHQDEREAAFRLLHQAYHRAGLTGDDGRGMRVLKHHLSEQTDVMVAKRNGEVVFTISLIRDAEHGMPLESLFAEEVEAMRAEGVRLAEVSSLASDNSLPTKSEQFALLVKMISLTLQAARRRGVDRLLLAVHPRHARVYQRLFGCVICSEVREYAAVEGNPAVLCMHDFGALDQKGYPLYEQVYNPQYAPWQLDGAKMNEDEKRYFGQAVADHQSAMVALGA